VSETGVQRILVVDDEPNIADLGATALRYEGFDVEIEGSGRGAMEAIRQSNPQLVVLDVMLPDVRWRPI
jgi:two-component system OmpR family response regulator